MTYYPTLAEDLARAKQILADGKPTPEDFNAFLDTVLVQELAGGTIFGKDTYAAYKLLESFVATIDAMGPLVELYFRLDATQQAILIDVLRMMLRHSRPATEQ